MTASYPVMLDVEGRRCVVIGGGAVAARKIQGLLAVDAEVTVVAPEINADVRALSEAGSVTLIERSFEPDDLDGAWFVVAATGDPAVNRAVFEEGERRRIWVNAADDPANCSVTLPAVLRQGPVTVAVSTSGQSPALASWLRRRLEAEIGPEYAVAAERQAVMASGRSTEDLDWLSALDGGMLEAIRDGDVPLAKERLKACLSLS